ncbi:ACT domain-containing protein [Nymphaea thermarum]|nr:ACT domain-containing protein [Nymphaea thermarum]
MGIQSDDDVVLIRNGHKEGDPTVITVNCPDKTGLGCDVCRLILQFGLSITRGDFSTDGKWCYLVLWVVPRPHNRPIRWSNLKKLLLSVCPSCSSAASLYLPQEVPARPSEVYLLKLCSFDRRGLLHDVTEALCELELTIRKVKVSTTPDGSVMDLFFVTDTREQLHTEKRRAETCERLRSVLGGSMISCELELVDPEMGSCQQASSSSDLASLFTEQTTHGNQNSDPNVSVTIDNSLSPSHTVVQILSCDHKGLLYDVMRTLKDYNIQVCYGRFTSKDNSNCEGELFIVQADGKKIIDTEKQRALCSRLRTELLHPLQVKVVSRGPDTELLVANVVELGGRGRPLVFYDITLALKNLKICIFLAEIARHMIGNREWEVYRILLLDDGHGLFGVRNKIEEEVRKMLMGRD